MSSISSYEHISSSTSSDLTPWFAASTLDAYPASVTSHLSSRAPDLPAGGSFALKLLRLVVPQHASYPPSRSALALILSGIAEAQGGPLGTQSDALAYYLLLDLAAALHTPEAARLWDAMTQADREELQGRPEQFARAQKLPRAFKEAVKGYWFVDRGQLKSALPFLPSADFQMELQRALSPLSPLTPPPHERAHLLVTLQRLTRLTPALPSAAQASAEEREAALHALQSSVVAHAYVDGLSAAWRRAEAVGEGTEASATYGGEARAQCKETLLRFCFEPHPQPKAIAALLALDMSASDEALLESFALAPTAPPAALDVLLVRRINVGDYLSAVRLHDAAPAPELSADPIKAKQLRDARRRIIEGARAVIPEVQRALIDVSREMEGAATAAQEAGGEMGAWENVEAEQLGTPLKSSTSAQLVPLSASPALRKPPSAASSPRSASHATDPLAALLSAVVRASPTRAPVLNSPAPAAQAAPADAPTVPFVGFLERKRESLGGAGGGRASFGSSVGSGPATPRSGPATPLRAYGTPTPALNGDTPVQSITPKAARSPAVVLATAGLTSRSPFAAPPRLPGPTAPGGTARRTGSGTSPWTSSGAQQTSSGGLFSSTSARRGTGNSGSPFGANLRRGEAGSGEMRGPSVPWGVEVVVPSRSRPNAAQEEDVEMADHSQEEREVPRRRGGAARKKRELPQREQPRSKPGRRAVARSTEDDDGDTTIPGHFTPDPVPAPARASAAQPEQDGERTASPPPRHSPAPAEAKPERAPRKAAVQARARITRSQSTTADLRDVDMDMDAPPVPALPPMPEASTPLVKSRSTRNAAAADKAKAKEPRPTRSQSLHSDLSSAASAREADDDAPSTARPKRTRSTATAAANAPVSSTATAAAAAGGSVRRSTRLSVEPEEEAARKKTLRRPLGVPAALEEGETEDDEQGGDGEQGGRRTRRARKMPGAL